MVLRQWLGWIATIFTLAAIGAAGYTFTSLAASLIERQQARRQQILRKQQMKRITALENHVLICGGGYVGKRIAHQFRREGVPFIVVEAAHLAANMLHPHTGAIWRMTMSEEEPLRFTEVHIDQESEMVGKSCAEIKIDSGHLVMSIYRAGQYLNQPDLGERCQPGDVLIILTEQAYDESKQW